jgi:transposase
MRLNVFVLRVKKSLRHPKANLEDREKFKEKINTYQKQRQPIIYIDESGFAHDMPRTHGYSQQGERCYGTQDWQARGRVNVIGAIQNNQLITASLFEGNIDSDTFHAWVVQDMLPKLPAKSIIVMDNATFHKRQDTQQSIQNAGHILEYLPAYSPDLNPIEQKWAHAKALRKKYRCDVDELLRSFLC